MVDGFKIDRPNPVPKPTIYTAKFELDELKMILKEYLTQKGILMPEGAKWRVQLHKSDHRIIFDGGRDCVYLIGEKFED